MWRNQSTHVAAVCCFSCCLSSKSRVTFKQRHTGSVWGCTRGYSTTAATSSIRGATVMSWALSGADPLLIDVRDAEEHKKERITGAVNLPLEKIKAGQT